MKLLNIQKEIPDILLDIRYCTTYNFIGEIIDGYIDPVALGTKELVEQLKVINSKARQMGYRLKIWDAYRPQSALDHFMTWKDTEDDKMKSIFYPKYSKSYLFENDFIIEKSAHTRAVDFRRIVYRNTERKRHVLYGSRVWNKPRQA